MDPCFARDPLLGLLPQYGHATAIMCAPVPLKGSSRDSSSEPTNNSPDNMSFGMTGHSERGISEGSFSKSQGNGSMLDEDHDSSEDVQSKWNDNANWDVDARDYFCPATEYGTETNFYHDPQGTPASKRLRSSSNLPDHRFLACLTVDLTEDTTPLALVCLAQDTEIHSALSSAMFQRLAWGILDPLIGVSFDRMNTTVRVVLGWLEERHDLGCPIVHVAYEPASIYDLSDPQQGLKFALLIGSEAGRFAYYQQRALEHYPRLLDNISEGRLMLWRIDQQALAPQFEHRETHADSRLQRWLDLTDSSNFVAPEKEM